jgi:hypothetical protein
MPGWNGVAATGTATLNLPLGLTYHSLLSTLGGGAFVLANISAIRFKINGRQIYVINGTQLNSVNQYTGLSAFGADLLLHLMFDRAMLKLRQAVEGTAIGTGAPFNGDPAAVDDLGRSLYNPTPPTSFQCEIDIAGATTPTLSSKAIQSGPSPLGAIIKRRRFNYSPAGAGDYEIADLPRGDAINQIFIFHANIDNVKIERDNFLSFDRTTAENTKIQTDYGVRVPQAGLWVIDPSEAGNGSEALVSAVQDFRLTLNMSAADNVIVFVDYIGGLDAN